MQVAQRNLEIAYHDTGYYDRRVAQLQERLRQAPDDRDARWELGRAYAILGARSEEHTSELQSQSNLVCRLLLEKKKNKKIHSMPTNWSDNDILTLHSSTI